MKTAGAGDKGKYPSRLATIRKSTSTNKTFWDRKTSSRISVPTTSSTWPIFRWPETLTSAWSGAARFKKHNNICGTAESITSVRHVTLTARGDPQRACITGIPMATSGSLRCTLNEWKLEGNCDRRISLLADRRGGLTTFRRKNRDRRTSLGDDHPIGFGLSTELRR